MKMYVRTPLEHDNKSYKPGDEITFSEAAKDKERNQKIVQRLLSLNVIQDKPFDPKTPVESAAQAPAVRKDEGED